MKPPKHLTIHTTVPLVQFIVPVHVVTHAPSPARAFIMEDDEYDRDGVIAPELQDKAEGGMYLVY